MSDSMLLSDRRIDAGHIAFGGFLAVIAVALLAAGAFVYAAAYGALLAVLVGLTAWRLRAPATRRQTAEFAFFAIGMNIAFILMRGAVPAVRTRRYDDALLSIDLSWFGGSINVWLQRWTTPALTDLLCACYLLFFPLLYASLLRYFFWHRERLRSFYAGLFTIYGLGLLGYLVAPAAGPYLAFPTLFNVPLDGGPITHLNQFLVAAGTTRVDVFPSLHCAVSAYILAFGFRHQRREFWILLLPIAGLWLATLYLRYHYLIDVLCGFLLALVAVLVSRRYPVTLEEPAP